jgi:hypothetical protein
MIKRCLALMLSSVLVAPAIAAAQQSKAGVVTVLEGNVSARRVALPNPVPLKFKDDVFLQDTVTTGDQSLVRMLLGGKAVVTVRERSILTITEIPGKSTIELESGKFALAVAREKMRPGEEIQIRTPNAIAGVRGTVVITEVNRQSAQVGGAAPAVVTNFYVLRGTITAQSLDPTTRQEVGVPLSVGANQKYQGAALATPTTSTMTAGESTQAQSGLKPTGPKGGGEAGKEQVKAQAVRTATTLMVALTGGPREGQGALAVAPPQKAPPPPPPPGASRPSIVAVKNQIVKAQELANDTNVLKAASGLLSDLLVVDVTLANKAAKTFTTPFTSTATTALITLNGAIVDLVSKDLNFIEVLSGGDVLLAGPLARLTNSKVLGADNPLAIKRGKLRSTSRSALFVLDSSTVSSLDALLNLEGGILTLAGPLFTDVNGTVRAGKEFLRMESNSTLTSTTTEALVQLRGTAVKGTAALAMINSRMTLAGPLLHLTNSTITPQFSLAVLEGATFTSTTGNPLIVLDNTSLQLTTVTSRLIERPHLVIVDGRGASGGSALAKVTLSGPLLRTVNGSGLDMTGALAGVFAGGKIVESHATDAFVSIAGGTHKIALDSGSTSAILLLLGRTGATTSELIDTSQLSSSASSTLTLGTDEPLERSGAGAYLQATDGATITTVNAGSGGGGVYVDTALLRASAPLLSLRSGASLTTAAEGINLASKARLTAIGPIVRIDGATLTIGNGSAINVAGGSFLNITSGDLLSMIGGTLTISNGAILRVADGSVVKVHGSLANFNNTAATVNLTNSCGGSCTEIGGLRILFTNGGDSMNVSIHNPFKNSGSTTINLSDGAKTAHVVVDGANSKLIISGN